MFIVSQKDESFFTALWVRTEPDFLAGIWKMINFRWSAKTAFTHEMCQNGYGAGNPQKPPFVVNKIRESLTPLFKTMSYMVASGRLSYGNMDYSVCNNISAIDTDRRSKYFLTYPLKCQASTKYKKKK